MVDNDDNKLLPFQYYNTFDYISLPTANKVPFIPNWNNKNKTVEPSYMDDNTALRTGEINNLTVIDIDVKDDGMAVWKDIISDHKEILTPTVNTPSGLHYYFKYNKNLPTMNRLVDDGGNKIGIDIRNNNAIVIAPPSIINGKPYKFKRGLSLNDVKPLKMPKYIEYFILDHMKDSTRKKHGL